MLVQFLTCFQSFAEKSLLCCTTCTFVLRSSHEIKINFFLFPSLFFLLDYSRNHRNLFRRWCQRRQRMLRRICAWAVETCERTCVDKRRSGTAWRRSASAGALVDSTCRRTRADSKDTWTVSRPCVFWHDLAAARGGRTLCRRVGSGRVECACGYAFWEHSLTCMPCHTADSAVGPWLWRAAGVDVEGP